MKDLRTRQKERAARRKEQMEQSSVNYTKEEIASHTHALENPRDVNVAESARTTSATTENVAASKPETAKAGNGGGKGWKATDEK